MHEIRLDLTMDDLKLLDLATIGDVDVYQQGRLDELHTILENTMAVQPDRIVLAFGEKVTDDDR